MFGPIALYIGTAIGAGIFAIPYAIQRVGFFIGIVYIVSIGILILLVSLIYGEIIQRTKGQHQLPKYAALYLGNTARILIIGSFVFGITGALTAYTVGVSDIAFHLLKPLIFVDLSAIQYIFFGLGSIAVFFGIGIIARIEKIMILALLSTLLLILIFGFPVLEVSHLMIIQEKNFLFPIGVLLFAFGAASILPDMAALCKGSKKDLLKVIIVGGTVPIIVYIMFTLLVLGIQGESVPENAITGFQTLIDQKIYIIGSIIAMIAMSTSFLSLGQALKEMIIDEFRLPHVLAWLSVFVFPFFLIFFHLVSFVQLIGMVGAVIGGIEGTIIVAMHPVAQCQGKLKPGYTIPLEKWGRRILIGLLMGGFVIQIFMIFKF